MSTHALQGIATEGMKLEPEYSQVPVPAKNESSCPKCYTTDADGNKQEVAPPEQTRTALTGCVFAIFSSAPLCIYVYAHTCHNG